MGENRDFKGVWIPKEIWLHEELSALEKVFLAEISSLDNGGCYASNEYFSEFLGVGVATVTRMIKHLKELGLIEQVSFDGRTRILKSVNLISLPNQNDDAESSKCGTDNKEDNNIYNNIYNNNINYGLLDTKEVDSKVEIDSNNNINTESKEREKNIKREKEKIEEDITEIIQYLNVKTGKNYRANVESNRSMIRARLNDHYTKEDCIKVIDIKCKKWMGTKFEEYLKVSTLFRPSHFDDYLNEKEEQENKKENTEVNQAWRDMWSRA